MKTYDLGLAAALVVKGFELEKLDKTNIKKVQFIFRADGRKGNIEEVVNEYFTDRLLLPAQQVFNAIKSLKNRIYDN